MYFTSRSEGDSFPPDLLLSPLSGRKGMRMDLQQRLENVGLTHFSASQLNKPVANWMFDYVYLSSEERRKTIVGENAILGTCAHSGIQNVLCNGLTIESAIDDALMDYDFSRTDVTTEKGVKFREILPDMIRTGVEAMSDKFNGAEEEKRIEINLEGVLLPIIGYVDLSLEGRFAEVKTKAPRVGAVRKDGTRGWTKGLLPRQPSAEHTLQAAIYWKATGAEPHIVYVSADNYAIFTPENCEKLSDKYLSYALEEVRRKCILRQNLLSVSDDPKVLAGLIEPDFGSFYWDDDNLLEAKKLWKI